MSKSPLAAMLPFRARKWFNKEFTRLAQLTADTFATRSEITSGGGGLAAGTVTTSALHLTYSAISTLLNGLIMSDVAAIADVNVLAAAGSVGAAIYEDGSAYTGDAITLGALETAYVTLVVTNSDGAGAAAGDDGAPLLIAVVAGTSAATGITATAFVSSVDVAAALAGSTGVHAGTTAWVHYAEVLWAGTPGATPTLNRNNAVSGS
jgi:hypothetical protein